MAEFLLEIGCEEIPAPWLADLETQLSQQLGKLLADAALKAEHRASASTPRRLIACFDVAQRQDDREVSVFGPSLKQAKDAAGKWTPAARGFARKNGVEPEALRAGAKDPGKPDELNLLFVQTVAGKPAVEVLPGIIAPALRALSFPKRMSWDAWLEDGKGAFPFGRPIRWIVALLRYNAKEMVDLKRGPNDNVDVVPFKVYEAVDGRQGEPVVRSGRTTRGHRFLGSAAGQPVAVSSFADLQKELRENFVIAKRQDRAKLIEGQLVATLPKGSIQGGLERAATLDQMLAEWPDLVEYPTVVAGTVPSEFATLPREVRDTVLVHHQKHLPFIGAGNELRFAAVTNGDGSNAPQIIRGMERVVVARLRDARFFYGEDRKTRMEDAAKRLSGVTFFQGLGSYGDKARRIERLVIAMQDQGLLAPAEAYAAGRAARVAKADLTTLMVGEFPELQGVMGALYLKAEADAEPKGDDTHERAVIHAVRWQYEACPPWQEGTRARVTAALGLADRLDTLAAHFSIGNVPSGSRDPYGLRRAGAQIIETLLDYWPGPAIHDAVNPWPNLHELIWAAFRRVGAQQPMRETVADLETFLAERLRFALITKGKPVGQTVTGERDPQTGQPTGGGGSSPFQVSDQWTADEVDAVLGARDPDPLSDPRECVTRLRALHRVRAQSADDFAALAAAFKRSNNILKQGSYSRPWDYERSALTHPAELVLAMELDKLVGGQDRSREAKDDTAFYESRLKELARLRPAVDRFFDDVMVMVDDPKLRRARLGLLGDLVEPFYRVADISKLGGQA